MNELAQQSDNLLQWMTGMADATRLRLLRLLERHELGVADLCDVLQMPQSTVSRHLKVLSDQLWVRSQRQGTTNLYHMRLDELEPAARSIWLIAREQTEQWPSTRQDQVRLARRLNERKRQTRDFFEGAAGNWDRIREELYGDQFSTDAMLAMLPDNWVVADLGCGTGSMTCELAKHVDKVIGIDESPSMLKAAKKRAKGLKNIELRVGDLESIPLDNAQCDAALLVMVLTYLARPEKVLAEARRTLKAGGRLVIVDLLLHDRDDFRRQMGQQCLGFSEVGLKAMLKTAGFDRLHCHPLPPAADAKGPALLLATGTVTN